jgi:MFS family permease
VTAVLVLFTLATLFAKRFLNCVGRKTLCFLSLLLGAVGCILISSPQEISKAVVPDS